MTPAVFLDRDGVINIDHAYVHRPEDFTFIDGVFDGCRALQEAGYHLVIVTNQSGIGRGYYSTDDFLACTDWMKAQFQKHGVHIDAVYYCPHHPEKALEAYRCQCSCRKPEPGMIFQAAQELNIDLKHSAIIGDKVSDVQAGSAAGIPSRILVGKDGLMRPKEQAPATHTARNLLEAAQLLIKDLA